MEQIPEEIRKIFKGLEDDVIEAILKRMEKIQEIIPASDYQLWRLDQIGSLRSDVKKKIQDALKLSKKEINKIYSETMKQNYVRDKRIYDELGTDQIPYEENEPLQQLIEAVKMQTEDEFKNITGTMGFITPTGPKLVEKEFTDLMDKALMEVTTGSFDYSTAIRTAVDEMVNSGVRWIDYESGHHNRVDVATRRALMTGVRQVTGKIAEMNAESLGTDKFEVSAHATARPDHQVWQGKVYTYDELVSVCGLGTGPGLCGWNCYHFYDPFYEGISVRKYTDEQLEQMNADANKKASYGNKEYTKYEATQEQRRLETQMRGLREKIRYLKEHGGSKEDIQNKEIKYNEYIARYKDFSEKMDLPFQPERIRTSDWSHRKGRKIEKTRKMTDITDEFMKKAHPGQGKWDYDTSEQEFRKLDQAWKEDEIVADQLVKFYGGNVKLRTPLNIQGRPDPDSWWLDGKIWEFKTPESPKKFNGLLKKGLEQIGDRKNGEPGGVVFSLSVLREKNKPIDFDDIKEQIRDRLRFSAKNDVTIVVLDTNGVAVVYEYK